MRLTEEMIKTNWSCVQCILFCHFITRLFTVTLVRSWQNDMEINDVSIYIVIRYSELSRNLFKSRIILNLDCFEDLRHLSIISVIW